MLGHEVQPLTEVGEKPKIEGCQRREAQIVADRAVDAGGATPVRGKPCSQPVVEIAGLGLEFVARASASGSDGVTVEIVQFRQARSDGDLIDQIKRVPQG